MMKMRKIDVLCCVVAFLLNVGMYAQTTDTPATVVTDSVQEDTIPWEVRVKCSLDTMVYEAIDAPFTLGLAVYDLTADTLFYAFNEQKVLRPASTQKLLTSITALSVLGGTHEYRTKAYYTGSLNVKDSTLNGDVYVVGDFDPTYTYNNLCDIASKFVGLGIRNVKGGIYADISMKDSLLYGKGWCWDDVPSNYEPYLGALLFNRGQNGPESTKYSRDPNFRPWLHFVKTLGDVLMQKGVTAFDENGDTLQAFVYGTRMLPAKQPTRCFYTSRTTVEKVLQRTLKNSDNLYAESLFWKLARQAKNKGCTAKDGIRQIETVLRKANASLSGVEIADGSGVSLYNYHSANTQIAMLRYAYLNENIFKYLYPALPVSGKDGTLSKRMTTGNVQGNVHAKTGTLEGVSSLSGYINAPNGHILAFSIIINGVLRNKTGQDFQDRVCNILAQ